MSKMDQKRKREVPPETKQDANLVTPSKEGKGNKRIKKEKESAISEQNGKPTKTPKTVTQRAGPSNSQRVGGSVNAKTVLLTEELVKYLEKKYLDSKNEPLSLEHIVGEIKKEKGMNAKLLNSLRDTLSSHPRVLVSSTPGGDKLYAYKPLYDINDRESLLLKLRNTGGLFLDDIKSSLPNADKVLSKLVGKSILYLPGKLDKETVVHYNVQSEVGKMEMDGVIKNMWRRLGAPSFDDRKVVEFLKKNSLTFLQHEIAANQVPPILKQLARLLAVTFNTREEALVVDRIVHFGCVLEESLEIICHFKGNQLKDSLAKLVSNRILQVGSPKESDLKFYHIDYQKLFNLVRYKLERIRQSIEVAQDKDPKPNYFCPTCKKEFTYCDVFNANKLENTSSGILCAACKIDVEDITDIKESRMEIFQRIMEPLYQLLQEAEGLELVPSIRPPQPANTSRFKRVQGCLNILSEDEDDGQDELRYSGLEGEAVQVIMGVGVPAKKLGTKEVPAWFTKSTVREEENVHGPSTADGKPKKVKEENKEGQVAVCAVELMYQAETYNLEVKVEVMDPDSSEEVDDDSVDPKHSEESVEEDD